MKESRHEKIRELIGQYEIETQEELAERLKAEGYRVTQRSEEHTSELQSQR